jgi:hypothetical protein
MTRMTREFSLVLLGAGVLTTGYFLWPEKDFEKRAEEEARARVGGNGTSGGHGFIFLGHAGRSYASAGGRPPAMAPIATRGFGSTGARFGAGS